MKVDLDLISAISIIAPALVGAIFYSRLVDFAQKLFWFVIFIVIIELSAGILSVLKLNNMFIFHIYTFGEVLFICLIYRSLMRSAVHRRMILHGFVIFQTISIINLLFFDEITHFNSSQRYVEMLIIYTILSTFAIQATKEKFREPLSKDPAFILTIGFMVYFLGTLGLFILADKMFTSGNDSYWILHGIFNISLNTVYTVVLLRARILPHDQFDE